MAETSIPSIAWRARPVFISSTFKDMHAERDWLRYHVFDRLEEELSKRRHHLEPIDLRIGVDPTHADTEEARELLVLKVCLNEIERSRPFLLVLLGDRYGWVPPVERIKTAAEEQGLRTKPVGKSVTALEIEFGILKRDPGQRRRSLFFFRRPLPWEKMPEAERANYSDAFASDPDVRAGHAKLGALKEDLRRDPELGPHVYEYTADWDAAANKVTNLRAFGELVFEKLWAAIDEETRAFAALPSPTWQEQERSAVAEFIEHRSRVFVGRETLIDGLVNIARSPTVEGGLGQSIWGACLTGPPGSGKSAVFAKLHRELQKDSAVVLLANTAGGSPRGSNVDAMLRRWVTELAAVATVADRLPENASPDDVEARFYSLLRQVSFTRRVVVLLDALDQFEPTPRGQHLTWFKSPQWPANARILATSLNCPAAQALSQIAGIKEINLPPLGAADAAEIGRQVWGYYHRELNDDVLRLLVDKPLPGGMPACGNPLWLTLALEQLNLLDGDDLARSQRDFTGSPTARVTALLLETARRMPPDVDGLYNWLLKQNEKAFCPAHVRGFAAAIALSRSGWRDSDLRDLTVRVGSLLFPGETVPPIDDLGVASLRRSFRAHLVRRGENGCVDFSHTQMRKAVAAFALGNETPLAPIHRAIADHLLLLGERDPLFLKEMMFHLMGAGDAPRAALFYAHVPEHGGGLDEATQTLVWGLLAAAQPNTRPLLEWIALLIVQPHLDRETVWRLSDRIRTSLVYALRRPGRLEMQLYLLEAARGGLERLTHGEPSNTPWQTSLSATQVNIGEVLREQGKLESALQAYRAGLSLAVGTASADRLDATLQRLISISQTGIGDILREEGDLHSALHAYRAGLSATEQAAAQNPSDPTYPAYLLTGNLKIGDILLEQRDIPGSLQAYRASVDNARAQCTRYGPVDYWSALLSRSYRSLGDAFLAQNQPAEALPLYRDSTTICERLAQADPADTGRQQDLLASLSKVGITLRQQNDLPGALRIARTCLSIAEVLVTADPSNAAWQRNLLRSYCLVAELLEMSGDSSAKGYWQSAQKVGANMKQRHTVNSGELEMLLAQLDLKTGKASFSLRSVNLVFKLAKAVGIYQFYRYIDEHFIER